MLFRKLLKKLFTCVHNLNIIAFPTEKMCQKVPHFTLIINVPEVAILGLSKGQMKPVWDGKQFVPRLTLPLSLSYDHRVIDGAAAARFNAVLAQVLADYRRILL